jgi:hypothetical protein
MQFAVDMKVDGTADHAVVDSEDALNAALKVKMQQPDAEILYVRLANKRGDARHPARCRPPYLRGGVNLSCRRE